MIAAVAAIAVAEELPELDPVRDLADARARRASRSTLALGVLGAFEVVGGMGIVILADDVALRGGAGSVLFVGGSIHLLEAWYQSDIARRRHAMILDELALVHDRPDAWAALATSARLQSEREARAHAYGTGLYSGVAAMGGLTLLTAFSGEDRIAQAGAIVLSGFGVAGVVHHGSRWRAAVRFAGDFDLVDERMPSVRP